MESKFLLDSFFECHALFKRQGIRFRNNRNNVNNVRQLLKHDNVNGFEAAIVSSLQAQLSWACYSRMTGGLNEEKTAVNPGILNITLTLRCKLFPQVGRMLVFNVFHDRIPAVASQLTCSHSVISHLPSIIIDLVAVAWGVHNI